MNTKIPQNQNGAHNSAPSHNQNVRRRHVQRDVARVPGKTYFLILVTTVILLFAFLLSFVVVLLKYKVDDSPFSSEWGSDTNLDGSFGGNSNVNTSNVSIGGNLPGKTVAKRTSYISSRASDVEYITDAIRARNVILVDLDSYQSIVEKSADTKMYPASMTKIMSLIIACENVKDLGQTFVVTQDIVDYSVRMGGSGVGLKVGDELSVQDLMYLTAYQSDTIAVIMLANCVAGSEAEFVKLMNAKAQQLKLTNTQFANCTGLHDPNNYTTCREMAAILAYALENPLCYELLTSYKGYRAGGKYLVYSSWYSGRFDDKPRLNTVTVTGGKTGYIDESGFCLASYAIGRSNGKKYIQVIVGQPKGSGYREELSVKDIKYVYNNFAE